MYAVGKLGSYISQGVYTVSGPFHPFGGAVDIIVVQQQDGSFKSSAWYVRFGNFQGVLKTKEKVVTICVNGVEAGFNMYFDHKGEAFFLRDLEDQDGEFVLSLPSSGDETEGRMKNGQYKKAHSFDVQGGQRELVTQMDNKNGEILTRTSSRRPTIFGLVFGRKSIKENDKVGNVERVSSLEHAEIAADLLEMKWSTNLNSSGVRADNTEVKPYENSEMNVCVVNEDQGLQTTLPHDGLHCDENLNSHVERMDDNFVTDISERNCSEEATDNEPSCLRASEKTPIETLSNRLNFLTEIYTSETGDKVNSDQKNSEFNFRNPAVDPQIYKSSIDGTSADSCASHVEVLGDINLNGMLTEKKFEEKTFHEEAIKIDTLEIGDSAYRNESISEFAPVHSNLTDVQDPGSVAYYDDTAQFYTKSHAGSTAGIPPFGSGENEIISNSHHETVESSNSKSNISDDKPSEHLGLPSGGTAQCEYRFLGTTSIIIPGITSLSESGSSLGKEISEGCHEQNPEISRGSESHVSENYQYGSPRNGNLEGSYFNRLNTESGPNSRSGQISRCLPILSKQELLCCEHEVFSMDVITKESAHEKETNFQQIDFLGNCSQMGEQEAPQISSFLVSIASNPLNSGATAESHNISEIPSSSNCSIGAQKENFDVGDNVKRSYSFEGVNVAQDFLILSKPTKVADCSVPCSECLEDAQFPFSDIDSLAKEIGTELPNNNKVAEEDLPTLTAECDVEEQDLQSKKHEQFLEGISDDSVSHSSPISIPGSKASFGETELSSRSLPIIHSHIKDLEGYDLHHLLSCSVDSRTDIYELDVHENEDSSSSKLEAGPQTQVIERHTLGVADADISAINEELKVTFTNTTTELSHNRHLLSEGTGSDAAGQVFDSEKDKIFEPQGMTHVEGAEKKFGASRSITPSQGSWNLWPFLKRSKTTNDAQTTSEGTKKMDVDLASKSTRNMTLESDMQKAKNSKKVQSLTPTSEELASLNLKEGRNVVTFSFSTPMLGLQQVDARIYLWKWNTRIVVSDVDGTITKSDVLGQFMPLVGVDWSQTGVAHLFSAIKGNGYQLLFLSARAISQAHLTRQFLFNLKQDGKALPDGPVVISPDGLFPSLYREVIRRAPHEFKISCLEAIKAIFPPECNPFYAGFGNRDTDEISYLKVGIPMGKIFIINPKGQVAVNRQVDTRSYASLHELVNGIFPPVSSFEQEDYNSWNYWKLPLPEVDM